MKLYLLLLTILLSKGYGDASRRGSSLNKTDAVSRAAEYLLKNKAENGMKNMMPRTVVALAFAAKSGSIPDATLSSLKKELNIQIYMHLSQPHLRPSLFELAQYVNALSATCQDPRSFQGMDLVAKLRAEVKSARKRALIYNSTSEVSPFTLLSLCIAKNWEGSDLKQLNETFSQGGNDRLSSKALTFMALACWSLTEVRKHPQVREFVRDFHTEFDTLDVYTKSLYLQAMRVLRALREEDAAAKLSVLQQHQLPDGSFGDALSTYYAIPALLNESLLDLRCQHSSIREQPIPLKQWYSFDDASGKVTYSLWIDQGSLNIAHSVKIGLYGNETFYDVMRKAGEENEAFRFLYDSTRVGKKVYSLAGIPNDLESRKAWNLYRGIEGSVRIKSKENLGKQTKGVDHIWPKDKDHFVFWFEQDSN